MSVSAGNKTGTALELRQRLYLARQVAKTLLWPPSPRNVRRVANVVRSLRSRDHASFAAQPFYAQIEPTTACNLECRFCMNTALPNPRHSLSYQQFVNVLDSMPELVAVNLQGLGEPTLNKDLFRMATEARRRGIYVFTVTNLNIPERMVEKLGNSDFDAINISLESTDPEKYEWFRVGGNLNVLEQNLRRLGELKKQNGRMFSIGIWTTLTEATIGAIEQVFKFGRRSGVVDRIQFVFLTDKASHVAIYDDALKAQRVQNRKETAARIRAMVRPLGKQYGILGTIVEGGCRWPWNGIYVDARGLLAPCCNIKDYHKPLWGDTAKGALPGVWQGPDWVAVREGLLTGKPHAACTGCPYAMN
jgi:MoaA/NifB/PqqE/SkfB family radical SAM enzyme